MDANLFSMVHEIVKIQEMKDRKKLKEEGK